MALCAAEDKWRVEVIVYFATNVFNVIAESKYRKIKHLKAENNKIAICRRLGLIVPVHGR